MIKISVCYSRKEHTEFASCSIGDIEIDAALLDSPPALVARIRTAYERCIEAVDTQLGGPPAAESVPPAIAARMATARRRPHRQRRRQRGTAKSARRKDPRPTPANSADSRSRGLTKWFSDLGRQHDRSGLIYEWDDTFAKWAYDQWLSQASAAPTNGTH